MRTSLPFFRTETTLDESSDLSFKPSLMLLTGVAVLICAAVPLWVTLNRVIDRHEAALLPFTLLFGGSVAGLVGIAWGVSVWLRHDRLSHAALALNEKRYRVTSEMMSDYTFYKEVASEWDRGACLDQWGV